ncbi:MAG: hypothetical protein KUG83_10120 [Gammaproteobacteria bacterium]|nr:hypothetical protein [Gammaproteobacteria bacterium]
MALPEDSKEVKDGTNVVSSISPSLAANAPTSQATSVHEEKEEGGRVWGILLAALAGGFATYIAMLVTVVAPLEDTIAYERSQKISYITSNQLDFNTFEPRLRELEASNAAKSRKEAVLIETIDQLSSELEKLVAPFEDVSPE